MEFYKYLHPDRIDVLETLKIRFTQAFALNDPFESFPGIVQKNKEWYREKFSNVIRDELENLDFNNSTKRKQYIRARKKDFRNYYRCYTDEKWLFEQAKSIALLDSVVQGYLSLSETSKNILMWSHYAHNHKGYVLGFNANHNYFSYGIKKIEYSDTRPWHNPTQSEQDAQLFYTKSTDWAYEKEYRKSMAFIEPIKLENGHTFLPFPNQAPDPNDKKLTEVKLFDYPADLITSVILGWKSDSILKDKVITALERNNISNVKLYKTVPHKYRYEMEVNKIEYI